MQGDSDATDDGSAEETHHQIGSDPEEESENEPIATELSVRGRKASPERRSPSSSLPRKKQSEGSRNATQHSVLETCAKYIPNDRPASRSSSSITILRSWPPSPAPDRRPHRPRPHSSIPRKRPSPQHQRSPDRARPRSAIPRKRQSPKRHRRRYTERGRATEHSAEESSRLRLVPRDSQKDVQQETREAQEDRADKSEEGMMQKVTSFLQEILELQFPNLTKAHKDELHNKMQRLHQNYKFPELERHKEMMDLLTRNKAGLPYQGGLRAAIQTFITWCKRVDKLRKDKSIATERAPEASAEYYALVQDLLDNDLTPAQKEDPLYTFDNTYERQSKVRSFVRMMCRKHLGHFYVIFFIFDNGLPDLIKDEPQRRLPTGATLQNLLVGFVEWHASLLLSLNDFKDFAPKERRRLRQEAAWHEWYTTAPVHFTTKRIKIKR